MNIVLLLFVVGLLFCVLFYIRSLYLRSKSYCMDYLIWREDSVKISVHKFDNSRTTLWYSCLPGKYIKKIDLMWLLLFYVDNIDLEKMILEKFRESKISSLVIGKSKNSRKIYLDTKDIIYGFKLKDSSIRCDLYEWCILNKYELKNFCDYVNKDLFRLLEKYLEKYIDKKSSKWKTYIRYNDNGELNGINIRLCGIVMEEIGEYLEKILKFYNMWSGSVKRHMEKHKSKKVYWIQFCKMENMEINYYYRR